MEKEEEEEEEVGGSWRWRWKIVKKERCQAKMVWKRERETVDCKQDQD